MGASLLAVAKSIYYAIYIYSVENPWLLADSISWDSGLKNVPFGLANSITSSSGLIFGGEIFAFFALLVWGAYTWRGLFLEFYGSTQIQYKNVNYYIIIFSQRLFD